MAGAGPEGTRTHGSPILIPLSRSGCRSRAPGSGAWSSGPTLPHRVGGLVDAPSHRAQIAARHEPGDGILDLFGGHVRVVSLDSLDGFVGWELGAVPQEVAEQLGEVRDSRCPEALVHATRRRLGHRVRADQ